MYHISAPSPAVGTSRAPSIVEVKMVPKLREMLTLKTTRSQLHPCELTSVSLGGSTPLELTGPSAMLSTIW
ncbi:MAG: hypothetical protein C4292_01590 [Nitrososphaera sp.]